MTQLRPIVGPTIILGQILRIKIFVNLVGRSLGLSQPKIY